MNFVPPSDPTVFRPFPHNRLMKQLGAVHYETVGDPQVLYISYSRVRTAQVVVK